MVVSRGQNPSHIKEELIEKLKPIYVLLQAHKKMEYDLEEEDVLVKEERREIALNKLLCEIGEALQYLKDIKVCGEVDEETEKLREKRRNRALASTSCLRSPWLQGRRAVWTRSSRSR